MDIRKRVVSLDITCRTYHEFLEKSLELGSRSISSYTCVANVHMVIEAYNCPQFANIVNNADLVTPDGMPLARSMKFLYGFEQERVSGMDLLPDLLKASEDNQISVFFYGGTQEMLDRTKEYCQVHFPRLMLAGLISPPFRALTVSEEQKHIDQINRSNPGFVFVALGCPKQEKWMASMKGRINSCMIGIGGALPVLIGMQKRAPKWMQNNGLEWLFRFSQEPRRLFGRYIKTNTVFIYLFIREFLKVKIFKED